MSSQHGRQVKLHESCSRRRKELCGPCGSYQTSVSGAQSGAQHATLLRYALSHALSRPLCGAKVWRSSGLAEAKELQGVERVYGLGELVLAGCLPTTATQSLLALTGLRLPSYEISLRPIMLQPSFEALDIRMHQNRLPAKEAYPTPLSSLCNLVQAINRDVAVSALIKNLLRHTAESHLEGKGSKTWSQGTTGHQLRRTNWSPIISRRRKWINPCAALNSPPSADLSLAFSRQSLPKPYPELKAQRRRTWVPYLSGNHRGT